MAPAPLGVGANLVLDVSELPHQEHGEVLAQKEQLESKPGDLLDVVPIDEPQRQRPTRDPAHLPVRDTGDLRNASNGRSRKLRKPRRRGHGTATRRLRLPYMPRLCYIYGMARVRISTTVDQQLLAAARGTRSGVNDAALIDEALDALLARNRATKIDAAYAAYDRLPLNAPDEWGDLASFRLAAGSS